MPLSKPQLAAMLFNELGLSEREAHDMVETFFEEICLALEAGESVNLAGFGRFEKDSFAPSLGLSRIVR